jgi:FkbM family methyltransferase
MEHPFVRAFGVVARLSAVGLVLLALVMALAPRYDWAWRARASLTSAVYRPVQFPLFAKDRDPRCSLADAWREAVPETALASRIIVRKMHVIQTGGGLEQVATPTGNFWIPAGDRQALAEELAEQVDDEYGGDTRGVQANDVVLDCGASAGTFTRAALRHGAKLVVAIEPAPWALECLRRNLREEIQSGRVILYPKGVWDHDDTLEINIPAGMASTAATVSLPLPGGVTAAVPLTTIDQLTTDLRLDRVDFIKMDIEGAEPNALRGAVRTVRQFHPRMAISLEHRKTDPAVIPALTRQLWPGYGTECGPCANMNGHLQPVVMFAKSARVTARADSRPNRK